MKNKKQIDLEIEDLQKSLNEVISKNHSRSNPRYKELKNQIKFLQDVRRVLYLTAGGQFIQANLNSLEDHLEKCRHHRDLLKEAASSIQHIRGRQLAIKQIPKQLVKINPLYNERALKKSIKILNYILV